MHIFKNFPKYSLFEKLNDSMLNYFENNKAPSTVSSSKPVQSPKYWVYLFDDNQIYAAKYKTGFMRYSCKLFNSDTTNTVEKNVRNKKIEVSLHLKGDQYHFKSIYTAFMSGFFKLIYVYRYWQLFNTRIGLLGNIWVANKLADRYTLLNNISKYHNSHQDDLDIMLHNKFPVGSFIEYVLDTKNQHLSYDLDKRINTYLRALSADNLITLDRDSITINDELWAEYVRLRPRLFSFRISFHTFKIVMKSLVGLAAIISAVIAVLNYIESGG